MSMEVLIAGGGIVGLTLALTCHQIGVPVRVFESGPELGAFGFGINLKPDAVRELHDLGLERELASISVATSEVILVGRDGLDVWSEARGLDAGCRWPQASVHRGELEMLLYRAVVERLGAEAVVTGHRLVSYEHMLGGVRAELATSDGSVVYAEGSLLVGADGLHSAVRSRMFLGDGGPRWGGSVLWRGVSSGPPVRSGSSFVVIGDAKQRFVTFPISAPDPATGLQLHNWIAELQFDPHRGWRRGGWNTRVAIEEFIGHFENWQFDWLDVPGLVRGSEEVVEYPMVDRDPVGHWVHGAVALVGDAAHAMYPVGSNGASQAILDARVLGAAFVAHGVGPAALGDYESVLLAARSAMVLRSRGLGPGSVLGVLDKRFDALFADPDALRATEIAQLIADYRAMSAAEIKTLNESRPTIAHRARA